MPCGLVMSQDVFQQRMDIILEQFPETIGIAYDIVVYGHNESEHYANLHCLMQVAVKEESRDIDLQRPVTLSAFSILLDV